MENPYEDTGGNEEEALTGVINIYFPDMKTWIHQYLTLVEQRVGIYTPADLSCYTVCVHDPLQRVVAKDVTDNHQLAKVLEVLALLVKYGYYDDPDDVEEVLIPLVGVMNGFSDVPFSQATHTRGSASGEFIVGVTLCVYMC